MEVFCTHFAPLYEKQPTNRDSINEQLNQPPTRPEMDDPPTDKEINLAIQQLNNLAAGASGIPDVPPFLMQPRFRWSYSERIHFSLADATALFISWRVFLRVCIRDRREGLEVCAANTVFRRSMRGSKILDASWIHLGSFLPTFPKIEGAVVLIASASLV